MSLLFFLGGIHKWSTACVHRKCWVHETTMGFWLELIWLFAYTRSKELNFLQLQVYIKRNAMWIFLGYLFSWICHCYASVRHSYLIFSFFFCIIYSMVENTCRMNGRSYLGIVDVMQSKLLLLDIPFTDINNIVINIASYSFYLIVLFLW